MFPARKCIWKTNHNRSNLRVRGPLQPSKSGHIMNRLSHLQYVVLLGFFLSIAAVLVAQLPPNKTLIVNGKTTGAAIMQINGRSYVDIETLAQITNGIVTVEPNRIVLTIPVSNSGAVPPPAPEGLSKN